MNGTRRRCDIHEGNERHYDELWLMIVIPYMIVMDGFRVTAHVPLFACLCFSADDFIELFGRSEPRLLGASAPTHRGLFILTCNTRDVRDFCDRRRTWRRLRQQGRYLRGITRWQGLASPTEQQAPGGNSSKTTSDLSE